MMRVVGLLALFFGGVQKLIAVQIRSDIFGNPMWPDSDTDDDAIDAPFLVPPQFHPDDLNASSSDDSSAAPDPKAVILNYYYKEFHKIFEAQENVWLVEKFGEEGNFPQKNFKANGKFVCHPAFVADVDAAKREFWRDSDRVNQLFALETFDWEFNLNLNERVGFQDPAVLAIEEQTNNWTRFFRNDHTAITEVIQFGEINSEKHLECVQMEKVKQLKSIILTTFLLSRKKTIPKDVVTDYLMPCLIKDWKSRSKSPKWVGPLMRFRAPAESLKQVAIKKLRGALREWKKGDSDFVAKILGTNFKQKVGKLRRLFGKSKEDEMLEKMYHKNGDVDWDAVLGDELDRFSDSGANCDHAEVDRQVDSIIGAGAEEEAERSSSETLGRVEFSDSAADDEEAAEEDDTSEDEILGDFYDGDGDDDDDEDSDTSDEEQDLE